jgi:hypothetical protein
MGGVFWKYNMTVNFKRLNDLFYQPHSELTHLFAKLSQLQAINQSLKKILTKDLALHCQAGGLEAGNLALIADSAAWATKLRYQSSEILQTLRQEKEFAGLKSIHIAVKTPDYLPPQKNLPKPYLSQGNARVIDQLADKIEDVKLRQSLKRLITNAKSA